MLTQEQLDQAKQQYLQKFGDPSERIKKPPQETPTSSLRGDSYFDSLNAPPINSAPLQTKEPNFLERSGTDVKKRIGNVVDIGKKAWLTPGQQKSPFFNPKLQLAGEAAGAVTDVAGEALNSGWNALPTFLRDGLKNVVKFNLGGEKGTQKAQDIVGSIVGKYSDWAAKHPDASKDLSALVNIATFVPAEELVGSGLKALEESTGLLSKTTAPITSSLAKKTAEKELSGLIDLTRPVLSSGEKVRALESGRGVSAGLFSPSKISPEALDIERANALRGIIDPKKDISQNIASTRNAIAKEADETIESIKLNDSIFNKKQLSSFLEKVEKPPLLASEPRLENAYRLVKEKFMSFVDAQPKKLSGLLQARKDFDSWMSKSFPNLYSDQSISPLKQAIRDMRNASNDFIDSKLPEDSPFRGQLRKQSLMFQANENMAEKGAKEVGTTKLEQIIKEHPIVGGVAKQIIKHPFISAGAAVYGGSKLKP